MSKEVQYLVCQPADSPLTVAGSSFDRTCCKCMRQVMVAPSGQKMLEAAPGIKVLCLVCFNKIPENQKDVQPMRPEQEAEFMAPPVRNAWKGRN